MKRQFRWLAVPVAAAILMAGCGSSSSYGAKEAAGAYAPMEDFEAEEASAAAVDSYYDEGFSSYDTADREAPTAEEASEEPDSGAKTVASTSNVALDSEKIVYYADISMSSINFEHALEQIREAGEKNGALIQSENFSEGDTNWYVTGGSRSGGRTYYVEYRVPAKNYRTLLDATGDMDAVVDSKSTSAQNITQQYSDMKAEIESLEAEKKQLQEIMDKATRVQDVLDIQERITALQTELNRDNSDIRRMDTDVSYSYVNINLREVRIYEEKEAPPEATFGERIINNFTASIVEVGEFFKALILFLVRNWLHLIILAALILVIVKIVRRVNKKNAEKRRAQMEERARMQQQTAGPVYPRSNGPMPGAMPVNMQAQAPSGTQSQAPAGAQPQAPGAAEPQTPAGTQPQAPSGTQSHPPINVAPADGTGGTADGKPEEGRDK